MDRYRRGFWFALAAAGSALVLLLILVFWALHPANLKQRLIDEVQRATGRTMTISGDVGLALSLVPTLSIENVTLSNPAGSGAGTFSRPEMLRIARVEISLALLPLVEHRFEISHLSLIRPDLLLETDKGGNRNWIFAREPGRTQDARPSEPPVANAGGGPFAVAFQEARIENGRIGWIDGVTGNHLTADVSHLTLTSPASGGVQANGSMTCDGHAIALTARTGEIDREPGAWPVAVRLESDGATLTAEGHLGRPGEGHEYDFNLDADVPDPKPFTADFPRLPLSALTGVKLHAEIAGGAASTPVVSAMTLRAGSIDLDALARGLRLTNVSLSAHGDEPVKVSAGVTSPGFDAGVTGTVNAPGLLASGTVGPVALNLDWNAASARGNVTGTIRSPLSLSGYSLDVAADVPRPSLLMERAPPGLRSLVAHAHLTDGSEPTRFQVTSSAGDLAGEIAVHREPRLSVTGQITSHRLDLDALRPRPAEAAPTAGPAKPGQDRAAPLISDDRLPFDRLRAMDANLKFNADQLRTEGTDLNNVTATVSAKDGVARIDANARSDQPLHADLLADATQTPPALHLTVHAPAVPLRLVLAALNLPRIATGTAEVHADLTAAGETQKQIAASLNGQVGIAVEGGEVDTRIVNTWLAELKPLHIGGGDATSLKCLAIRADAKSGVVAIEPLALNTAALILEGNGDVDLGKETLALRVRPRTKIGGTGIALPLRIGGPMRSPSAKIDISPASGGGGALAGLLLGGKDIMGAAGGGDPCPDALARAREAAAGDKP